MSAATDLDLNPAYVAGLLDATARVRFDFEEHDTGEFTVRPTLRIKPEGSHYRKAVLDEFLNDEGFEYDFVDRNHGQSFYVLRIQSDLERLQAYLAGHSAHVVRELAFVNEGFVEHFDHRVLDEMELCRLLKSRDELRYGWRPRGINFRTLEETATDAGIDPEHVQGPPLPEGEFRSDYSIEWIAGLYDGLCRYRPSIAETSDYRLGYAMYPTAILNKAGVSRSLVDAFLRFCEDYNLDRSRSSSEHTLRSVFTGAANIRRLLDIVFPRLLVLAEASELMLHSILPRFDQEFHRERTGFYDLLVDFEKVAAASGEFKRERTFTSEYFAAEWADELDVGGSPTPERAGGDSLQPEAYPDVRIEPESYTEVLGRYQTILERQIRDEELVEDLKNRYADRCQVCGKRLSKPDGRGHSEVHYLKPLGDRHDGPDVVENMLVLCPNHHADFDNGVIAVDPDSNEIVHPYDSNVDGTELSLHEDHDVDASYLRYHYDEIVGLETELID